MGDGEPALLPRAVQLQIGHPRRRNRQAVGREDRLRHAELLGPDKLQLLLLIQVKGPQLVPHVSDFLRHRLDRQPPAVAREDDAVRLEVAGLEAADFRTLPGVEQPHAVGLRPHRDELPIRAERDGEWPGAFDRPLPHVHRLPGRELGHRDAVDESPARLGSCPQGHHQAPLRGDGEIRQRADLRVDPADDLARGRVPDAQDAILAVGDEVLAVRDEGDPVDRRVLAVADRPESQDGARRQRVAVEVKPRRNARCLHLRARPDRSVQDSQRGEQSEESPGDAR